MKQGDKKGEWLSSFRDLGNTTFWARKISAFISTSLKFAL